MSAVAALYMDAEIRPNRSLSQRGFLILLGVITFANFSAAAVFLAMGATFVPIFLGFDLLAVIVAFLASYRSGRTVERVRVTPHEISITHETPKWSREVWRSPTAFTRITVEREEERTTALKLSLSGREVAVAEVLSPRERADFARALERAISEARRHRG
ncbi:DUF2244 domain-containing protein [Phenylobacterium deserti]|nr:DUF2244 domain-containing protein [Phenylobacterium deserti]